MNNNEQVCENCEETKYFHFKANRGAIWYCSKGSGMWQPKPTPDPKVEQVAKRYDYYDSSAAYQNKQRDAKIESLEKELRVYKRAIELSDADGRFFLDCYLEAARKEQQNA